LFRTIYGDLLSERFTSDNASSVGGNLQGKDWDNMSMRSMSTMGSVKTNSVNRLQEICDALGAPRGFQQIVGHHLLGHAKTIDLNSKKKAPLLNEIIDFMAKVFNYCTCDADITIIAIDDMHNCDTFSWKVLQKIFDTSENVLFVCGSRPFNSIFNVDNEFWSDLNGAQKEYGRFDDLHMGPLNQFDLATMASYLLSCSIEELDTQFLKDIFNHTQGMPHFAYQALENCKRNGLYERLENNKIGWNRDTTEVNSISP
jgi:predicted ATPase